MAQNAYQVCVSILEANQLAWLNMDLFVRVTVGNQTKNTKSCKNHDCPYYNESFVFDVKATAEEIGDEIIDMSLLPNKLSLTGRKVLCHAKVDVSTVWLQPDHHFYRKWAMLTDPEDIADGPKGYLRCNISVVSKGEVIKIPSISTLAEEDLTQNMMFPYPSVAERHTIRYIVQVYFADGLWDVGHSKWTLRVAPSPYVQVSFSGFTARTQTIKHSFAPEWNEQVIFNEAFPPLCQRIKVEVKNDTNGSVIATHFLDLKAISKPSKTGFLPTFGPSFVHLYNWSVDKGAGGDGDAYRGRLLLRLKSDKLAYTPLPLATSVTVTKTAPANLKLFSKPANFLLFGAVFDVTAMNIKMAGKSVHLELSIGGAGNALHSATAAKVAPTGATSADTMTQNQLDSVAHSSTPSITAVAANQLFCYLPLNASKPCMSVVTEQPDGRRRMYNANWLTYLAFMLNEQLSLLEAAGDEDEPSKLSSLLASFSAEWALYAEWSRAYNLRGKLRTILGLERAKLVEGVGARVDTLAALLKEQFNAVTAKQIFKDAREIAGHIAFLSDDPQHNLPDVFVWLLCDDKRVAYCRIPSRDLLYSAEPQMRGYNCGKVQSLILKAPGRASGVGPTALLGAAPTALLGATPTALLGATPTALLDDGGEALADVYLWLGLDTKDTTYRAGLPLGYTQDKKPEAEKTAYRTLSYYTSRTFDLRAHIFSGQFTAGLDRSSLGDPFVRVVMGDACRVTHSISETLNPRWDETLVVERVKVYGAGDSVKENPPTVILFALDRDKETDDLIGSALIKPYVKLRKSGYSAPQLQSIKLFCGHQETGDVVAAFELLEDPSDAVPPGKSTGGGEIPPAVHPRFVPYRLDVYFWGLRDLRRLHLLPVLRPRITLQLGSHALASSTPRHVAHGHYNFQGPQAAIELSLREDVSYLPPMSITLHDWRGDRFKYVGTHNVRSVRSLLYPLLSADEYRDKKRRPLGCRQVQAPAQNVCRRIYSVPGRSQLRDSVHKDQNTRIIKSLQGLQSIYKKSSTEGDEVGDASTLQIENESEEGLAATSFDWSFLTRRFWRWKGVNPEVPSLGKVYELDAPVTDVVEEKTDWWTKYHSSTLNTRGAVKLKIYTSELEEQPEFNRFQDWLNVYPLERGKKFKNNMEIDPQKRVVGYFKASMRLYQWPSSTHYLLPTGLSAADSAFEGYPANSATVLLVRVYVIRATGLHPSDMSGKADPFIRILLNDQEKVNDVGNALPRQLNPVFGRCFEMRASLPADSTLTIRVMDRDRISAHDLLGETVVDVENRYYTHHRATCGLASHYKESGYNEWRDYLKPTQILEDLCQQWNVTGPTYQPQSVQVGEVEFHLPQRSSLKPGQAQLKVTFDEKVKTSNDNREQLALLALHSWDRVPLVGLKLVPEHVETRSLYHPRYPGIEQGKLVMWIDLFPASELYLRPPVDVSARLPESYELRIIIWNLESVRLSERDIVSGKENTDIYVKGWMEGPEDEQQTDVHYNSLTGEGNFNWRFVFSFDYVSSENCLVFHKRDSVFATDETEYKLPCQLFLQVWDNDLVWKDDYLGTLAMDLSRMPRGAASPYTCRLEMLDPDSGTVMFNLFRQRRARGWWPFTRMRDETKHLVGKLEAEFELLPKREAEKNPVGMGRKEPEPLPAPIRPEASLRWLTSPLMLFRLLLCARFKVPLCQFIVVASVVAFVLLYLWAMPGLLAKKTLRSG